MCENIKFSQGSRGYKGFPLQIFAFNDRARKENCLL